MTKQRKPGDYVVNAELTEEQIKEFVRDCVDMGASRGDTGLGCKLTGFSIKIGYVTGDGRVYEDQPFYPYINNVTEEYKEHPMTILDLPTALEECAEHIRAGRDPRDYYQGRITGRNFSGLIDIVDTAFCDCLRRKPQTITVNGQEVLKPDDVFWTDIEKEVSFIGERTIVNAEIVFDRIVKHDDLYVLFKALRGEHNE